MLLLNDDDMENDTDIIILITWIIVKSLLESKDVLYKVSSDLSDVNNCYNYFSDAGQKVPPGFQKLKKSCLV